MVVSGSSGVLHVRLRLGVFLIFEAPCVEGASGAKFWLLVVT